MKNKLLKIGGLLACTFLVSIFGMFTVNAASGSVYLKVSSSKILVGNTVTVTATVSSTSAIGSWDATLSYDTAKLRFVSSTASGQRMVGYGDGAKKSVAYTFVFKAIASGTASIYTSAASILDWTSEQEIGVVKGSASVSIITQAQLEESYSKNNYLSALSIEGVELNPVFNKDTLEYSVELAPETPKIIITATKEDSKSTVTGGGEVALTEGDNRIEIKVNAENGNLRTYIINAKVKEYNPIEVKVNGETYTVVRKKASLVAPANYREDTVTISEEEVPAFTSDITSFTLVALKDTKGTIGYYIYNSSKGTYTLYQELSFNKIVLYPIEIDKGDVPKGYKKTTITYNDIKVTAYKLDTTSKFALLYGMNVETGKKDTYIYDSKENTIQRYYDEETNQLRSLNEKYFVIMIILGSVSLILCIAIIVILVKRLKKSKKKESKSNLIQDTFIEKDEIVDHKNKK